MLEELLRALKNYFISEVYVGDFIIENGAISVDFLKEGQYFKIYGSILNDGVYQYPATDLVDEEFNGEVWALAIPKEVVQLSQDIDAWHQKYGTANSLAMSPYNSESFGGYSYSKSSGSGSGSGISGGSWQSAFASRLEPWRKIRYESSVRRNDYVRNS